MSIQTIATTPFSDQQMGTSGLRKKTRVFLDNPNYLPNFLQSCFDTLTVDKTQPIIIGGDGRFYNEQAIQTAVELALGNGFTDIRVCQHGYLSTPACSHLIRKYGASLGIIFSASHNPGGEDGDVGVKINGANGGPLPLSKGEAIFERSQVIDHYYRAERQPLDLSICQTFDADNATISIIDGVSDYVALMQAMFDFPAIKQYLVDNPLCFDAMHAITGPYAIAIFHEQLGLDKQHILNAKPLTNFGGGHPDPNPTVAKSLYQLSQQPDCPYALLAASDGDGDRNMILGKGIFINPSDSLAMIAAHDTCLPYFQQHPLTGVARSLPTSRALDAVASANNLPCYATPTGWKFFGNLLDANLIGLCGEESFGTSGSHIREKDGIWAVLCWLNILANKQQSVAEIANAHWKTYQRHYYCRYDFEQLDSEQANALMANLNTLDLSKATFNQVAVSEYGQFNYTDPTDNSTANNQGFQVIFGETARFIVRLSGTGTAGATLRLYLEIRDTDIAKNQYDVVKPLATFAINTIGLAHFCQKTQPDYII